MFIIAKIDNVEVQHDAKPREYLDKATGEKSLVHWAKVLAMGASFNVRNPKKFSGRFDQIEVEAEVIDGARTFQDRESKQVSAATTRTLRYGSLLVAVPVKSK